MRRKIKQKSQERIYLAILVFIIVVIALVGVRVSKYIPTFFELFFKKEITLKQTEEKRINILLLGIGGENHDGPNLTDTIIYASIDPEKQKVNLISIPRDLWIPELKAKINTAYASGEDKEEGGGLKLSKAVVARITGQEIDYALRVDFNGFIKAVDMVGGLDIDVEKTFDDYEYPIAGKQTDTCGVPDEKLEELATESSQLEAFPCRYEHLHFEKGIQHMDGKTALKFVRSRHGNNSEGTDFARSKRQEKVILAFKDKVFSLQTFLNPVRLLSLYDVFEGSIDTDIEPTEMDDFIKLAQKLKNTEIKSTVLDYGDENQGREGLLVNPPFSSQYGYQWVIIPRVGSGNYKEIQEYVKCEIEVGVCLITPTKTQLDEKEN